MREAGVAIPARTPKSKRANKGKDAHGSHTKPKPAHMPDERGPTPERAAKEELVLQNSPLQEVGRQNVRVYRAPPPIERMRDANRLDHRPEMNEAMYRQAEDLQRLQRKAGMIGVAAQDLTRAFGGDRVDPPYMMARTEAAAAARGELHQRLNFIGLRIDAPLYGNARVVYAVVCEELSFAVAGRLHCGQTNDYAAAAVAKDRVRAGLMALVDLSRMKHRPALSRVLGGVLRVYCDA